MALHKVSERARLKTMVLTGNEAAAEAAKLARVKVVCFFPIGPSDEVGETLVQMIRKGELDARVIDLENERSSVNAQLVATQAGVRSIFSTNSEGLAFAYQPLFWAAYARVPIVVTVAHRMMEPPGWIVTDDHDTILFRDTHWIQFYCESPQDVFDTTIQAYRIAQEAMLPVFVTYAGWEVSHATLPVQVPSQELVDEFLPPYELPPEQDFLKMDMGEYYAERVAAAEFRSEFMEMRYKIDQMLNVRAKEIIRSVHEDYVRFMGRGHGGLIDSYKTGDADVVLVAMGNVGALVREVAKDLRAEGKQVGMLNIRCLRPFPTEDVRQSLQSARVVMALDRNPVYVLYQELKAALYGQSNQPRVLSRVIGLGGRDLTMADMHELASEALEALKPGNAVKEIDWRLRVARG